MIRNVYLVTKAVDSTRPVIDVSGFYHVETDIYDVHDYEQYKDVFYERYGKMNPGDPCWEDEEHGKRQKYDGKTPLFMSEFREEPSGQQEQNISLSRIPAGQNGRIRNPKMRYVTAA